MLREILNLYDHYNTRIEVIQYTHPSTFYTPSHVHKETEILMIKQGNLKFNIQGECFTLNEDDIIIINSNVVHDSLADFMETHYILQFNFSSIIDSGDSDRTLFYIYKTPYLIFRKNEPYYDELRSYILNIYNHNTEDAYSLDYIKGYFYQLFGFFKKVGILDTTNADFSSKSAQKILDITKYINENYASGITLESLSRDFYLNPSYLCRAFKKYTSMSITEYLNHIRVKKAELLLATTKESVTTIAQMVGFSTQSYFNRVFKGIMSVTPAAYRQIHVNKDKAWIRVETKE